MDLPRDLLAETSLDAAFAGNRLLATLSREERAMLEPEMELISLSGGESVLSMGKPTERSMFPFDGLMVSMRRELSGGRSVEVAAIGREGAVGGIISCGHAPAFTQAVVQLPGSAAMITMPVLEKAKQNSAHIRNLFCRYADALLAQVMQSVACNAAHPMEARLCRWLLTSLDRVGSQDLPLTQAMLAEMLGVQRTTVNAAIQSLHGQGVIATSRGLLHVLDRAGIERRACECYGRVEDHFAASLPEVRPQAVDATA
jgi:CRP-like cAMP-binding protein